MMDDSMSELSLVSWHSGPRSFSLQQRAPSKLPKQLFSPIRSSKQTARRQRYAVNILTVTPLMPANSRICLDFLGTSLAVRVDAMRWPCLFASLLLLAACGGSAA